jgi:uncharacterized protein DUF2846
MHGRIAFFATAVTLAMLAGCASVPMADPAADSAAKGFSAPRGKAGVYIYRNETYGAALKMDVLLDDRQLGETASKTYFYVEVEPGIHTVTGKAENDSSMKFNAVAGRLYYFWQEVKLGLIMARNELKLVDEATGRAGVMESKLISTK